MFSPAFVEQFGALITAVNEHKWLILCVSKEREHVSECNSDCIKVILELVELYLS